MIRKDTRSEEKIMRGEERNRSKDETRTHEARRDQKKRQETR